MWSLFVIPLVLSSAQQPDINGTSNWVNAFLLNGNDNENIIPGATGGTSQNIYCVNKDDEDGKCVRPQYCKNELPVVDPSTLFDDSADGCPNLLMCCPLDLIRINPKKTNKLAQGCGWSNPGGYSLRISDNDPNGFTDFADFPWMVAVLKKSFGKNWNPQDFIGGGTLIHPSVVLTVAHKVDSTQASEIKCRAGEWDFQTEDEIYSHQDRNVRKVAVHTDFFRLRAHYDAALLFLESQFNLENVYHIGVACLARDMPAPGTLCYSMGWGRSFNDTNNTTLLKKILLPIVDPETCQRQLRNTHLGSGYQIHHSLCCAGGEAGVDTCIGDGGSSLVCPVSGNNLMKRYIVYGMVAYGVGCGGRDIPGVYAKIPVLLDWINREMQGEQYSTNSYVLQ